MSWLGPRIDVAAGEQLSHTVVRSIVGGVPYATYVFKATFEIVPGGAARLLAPEAVVLHDRHRAADPRSSVTTASEAAPFLSSAAIVMTGTARFHGSASAHGEHGAEPAPFGVRLAVIATSGALVDKHVWIQPRGAEPTPLVYEDALATRENPAGSQWPRIIDAARAAEAAGFGPIAATWPSRQDLLHGKAPPAMHDGVIDCGAGLDARFFNPAPLDQQTAFLEGTETIIIEGVDADLPRLATHLGGVSVTVSQRAIETASLEARLDMLVIDADRRRLSLIWRAYCEPPRGAAEVAITAVLRSSRPIPETSSPPHAPSPHASAQAKPRVAPKTASLPIGMEVASALPFAAPGSEPRKAVAPVVINAGVDPSAKRRLEQTLPTTMPLPIGDAMPFLQSRPPLESKGQSERTAEPPIPATPYDPSFQPPSLKHVPKGLVITSELTLSQQERLAALLSARNAAVPAAIASLAPGSAPPPPPPPPPPAPSDDRGDAGRASVLARLKESGAPRDLDLAGADLSDLDLAGLSFSGSKLDGANLSRCVLREANLAGVSLRRVRLENAVLDGADLTGAILTSAVLDGASFVGARLHRADLSAVSAKTASFVGVDAERAKLTGAVLDGAVFTNANLLGSDWTKARAAATSFANAKLEAATLVQLSAERAIFSGANMVRVDAERAVLTDAILDGVDAREASFEQASLVRARLDRARIASGRFSKASLDEASLVEADLTGADFSKCVATSSKLTRAMLAGANLKQANFSNASFANAKLTQANLGRGSFARATFDGADMSGADAREARLGGANFSRANLTGADFRDADLCGTTMPDAILVDTKLKGAKR